MKQDAILQKRKVQKSPSFKYYFKLEGLTGNHHIKKTSYLECCKGWLKLFWEKTEINLDCFVGKRYVKNEVYVTNLQLFINRASNLVGLFSIVDRDLIWGVKTCLKKFEKD